MLLILTYPVTLVQQCSFRGKIPIARSNQPFARLRPTRKVRSGISLIDPTIFDSIAGYQDSRHVDQVDTAFDWQIANLGTSKTSLA